MRILFVTSPAQTVSTAAFLCIILLNFTMESMFLRRMIGIQFFPDVSDYQNAPISQLLQILSIGSSCSAECTFESLL